MLLNADKFIKCCFTFNRYDFCLDIDDEIEIFIKSVFIRLHIADGTIFFVDDNDFEQPVNNIKEYLMDVIYEA